MQMYRKGMVDGMEIIPHAEKHAAACGPCYQGKQTREPIPKEVDSRATEPLYRIHSDLCDVGQSSREGCRYYATFIDDYSRYTEVVPLKTKDETLDVFKKFVARAENELGKRVVRLTLEVRWGRRVLFERIRCVLCRKGDCSGENEP